MGRNRGQALQCGAQVVKYRDQDRHVRPRGRFGESYPGCRINTLARINRNQRVWHRMLFLVLLPDDTLDARAHHRIILPFARAIGTPEPLRHRRCHCHGGSIRLRWRNRASWHTRGILSMGALMRLPAAIGCRSGKRASGRTKDPALQLALAPA
jgi:hypothetical protein